MQNAEQSTSSLWSRIAGLNPLDQLYKAYSDNQFEDIEVDNIADPELYNFIKETRAHGPAFENYPLNKIAHFVERIHELRKHNTNNPT